MCHLNPRKLVRCVAALAPVAFVLTAVVSGQDESAVPDFEVRDGYRVTLAADDLTNARFMAIGDDGALYVTRPMRGDIIALRDTDNDGLYETRATFIEGKRSVHGIQAHDGWIWYTTSGAIYKARDADGDGAADEQVTVIPPGELPSRGGHWWRALLVTNEHFYTSIGDAGNISDQRDTDRQKIWRYNLDGSGKTLFSTGVRNNEKLRLRPGTDEVWGLDHGSDWYGREAGDVRGAQRMTDLWPPDELNHYEEGKFYGHPFIVGPGTPRLEYLDHPELHELAMSTTPPEWNVGAHWATNGFCFIDPARNTGPNAFPEEYEGDLVLAAHGSWNSSIPVGYCIARILFDDGKPYGLLTLVETIRLDPSGGNRHQLMARPVDCVQAPDGSILWSCDHEGRVYRLAPIEPGADDAVGMATPADAIPVGFESFGPIAYYDASCARCHGPGGAMYADTFPTMPNDKLTHIVDEMAAGPSLAPIEGAELEALVAYHRALQRGEPFIAITARTNGLLEGEVTPEADVAVRTASGAFPAVSRDGAVWTVQVNDDDPALEVRAVSDGGAETVLPLSARPAHSHTD